MKTPLLHQFLGLAGIYARLAAQDKRLDMHARRLARQEKLMSKATGTILALAAGLATLATAQKREADDTKKFAAEVSDLLASKAPGDAITDDELTKLSGFATAVTTAADNANARADELETAMKSIPTEPASAETSDTATPAVGETSASTPDPAGTPVATAPSSDTVADGSQEIPSSAVSSADSTTSA